MQKKSVILSLVLVIVFIFLSESMVIAQKYNIAAGLRWGGDLGISVSERIAKRWTLEQNINSEDQYNYYSAFVLARRHQPLITSRFNWFYGGGLGIVRVKETPKYQESSSISALMQTGLELTVDRLNLYVALEPYFYNTNAGARFKMHKVFAVKYVIVKRKSKWKQNIKKRFKIKKKKHKKKKKRKKQGKPWWKIWEKEK